MEDRFAGRVMLFKVVHSEKASSPISTKLDGKDIVPSFVQLENAALPMVNRFCESLTDASSAHHLKDSSPMLVTPLPIVAVFNFAQELNVPVFNCLTLFGTFTLVKLLHPLKA